jgi:hypothetical protein
VVFITEGHAGIDEAMLCTLFKKKGIPNLCSTTSNNSKNHIDRGITETSSVGF